MRRSIVADKLVLTGVPVPRVDAWSDSDHVEARAASWKQELMSVGFRSHFLHDIYFRCKLIRWGSDSTRRSAHTRKIDLLLTSRIVQALKNEVQKRDARLVVGFIPSKKEVEGFDKSPPYQVAMSEVCQKLGIEHFDLGPNFKKAWLRTYYRFGMHWNAYGHEVAAEAIYNHLRRNGLAVQKQKY